MIKLCGQCKCICILNTIHLGNQGNFITSQFGGILLASFVMPISVMVQLALYPRGSSKPTVKYVGNVRALGNFALSKQRYLHMLSLLICCFIHSFTVSLT